MAVAVEGDGADGVVGFLAGAAGKGDVGDAGALALLGFGEAFALAIEDQLGVIDEGHAVRLGEGFGAGADEVNVMALVEDEARGLDGVADALDAGDAAGAHGGSVHDEGVKLDAAVASEEAAAAGIKGRIVFHCGNGGLDGVDGGGAALEETPAFLECVKDALFVSFEQVGRNVPGAAVNEEDGGSIHKKAEQGIVSHRGTLKASLPGARYRLGQAAFVRGVFKSSAGLPIT